MEAMIDKSQIHESHTVSRDQILKGVHDYITQDIVPSISDVPLQILLYTGASLIMKNGPAIFNSLMSNPIISALIPLDSENGVEGVPEIDINPLLDAAKEAMQKFGSLPIVIPGIKFISPSEKILKFKSDDIDKLRAYICGEHNHTEPEKVEARVDLMARSSNGK